MSWTALHDCFDRAFGRVAGADCADLLDWPGKTTPISAPGLAAIGARHGIGFDASGDHDRVNRVCGQAKLMAYKEELLGANPVLAPLAEVEPVFLMRSAEATRALPGEAGAPGAVVVDALWFSFASFAVQSLLARWPDAAEPGGMDRRLTLTLHFAARAGLYRDILTGRVREKDAYRVIWETWPTEWEGDFQLAIHLWTALGRFVVAHELSHLLLHEAGGASPEAAAARGLLPAGWDVGAAIRAEGRASVEGWLYEVEADRAALALCESYAGHAPQLAGPVLYAVLYLFLCLDALDRMAGGSGRFARRAAAVRAAVAAHPLVGETGAAEAEAQFRQRAGFWFDMAGRLMPAAA